LRDFAKDLLDRGFKGELKTGEPLSGHCSLKVGGPADLLVTAEDLADLEVITGLLDETRMPWMVLGGGTNTLFANGGFAGCIIRLGNGFSEIRLEGDTDIVAGASAVLQALVARTGEEGLTGLECLAGIPGTVGGAVRMNAGTRSGDISGAIEKTRVFSNGQARWLGRDEMGFAYRSSELREGDVILSARFNLSRSEPGAVREGISEQAALRKKSQPMGVPTAGCWFRNPAGDNAGRLIDEAGMKGAGVGGARVSEKHANFLVNTGSASADDFLSLARQVREAVGQRFGVWLEEEVKVIDG
jgi:UDP-N-acetylmuramate dehydrogenase